MTAGAAAPPMQENVTMTMASPRPIRLHPGSLPVLDAGLESLAAPFVPARTIDLTRTQASFVEVEAGLPIADACPREPHRPCSRPGDRRCGPCA
jgi:hypothetical protein